MASGPVRLQQALRRIQDDLHDIDVLWQLGVLALCLLAGWLLARQLVGRLLQARLRARERGALPGATASDGGLETGRAVGGEPTEAVPAGTVASGAVPGDPSVPSGTGPSGTGPGGIGPGGIGPGGTAAALAAATLAAGLEALARAMWPLASLMLVLAARAVLARYMSVGLLDLAMPLLGAFALLRALVYAAQRSFPGSRRLLPVLRLVAVVVWTAVALHLAGLADPILDALDRVVLPLGKHKVSLLTVAQATLTIGVTLLLALWAGRSIEARLMRAESIDSSLRAVLARVLRAALLLAAVLVALSSVGLDLTVLSVFGGALGVGLGLGLQRIASNYVSGFIILLDRGLRIGDLITVDKYNGRVTQIKTRYTVLRSLDGTEAVVPNELLVAQAVTNHSFASARTRLALQFPIAHGCDLDATFARLAEAAATHPRVVDDPPAAAHLTRIAADGLDVELEFWIDDPLAGTLNVRSDVGRAVLKALRELGVEVPLPQHRLQVQAADALPVTIARAPARGATDGAARPAEGASAPDDVAADRR